MWDTQNHTSYPPLLSQEWGTAGPQTRPIGCPLVKWIRPIGFVVSTHWFSESHCVGFVLCDFGSLGFWAKVYLFK